MANKKPSLGEFQPSLITKKKIKKPTPELKLFGTIIRASTVRNKKAKNIDLCVTPMELPEALKAAVAEQGGSWEDFDLVGFKELSESDVKRDQNRLYVPKTNQLMQCLTDQEKANINNGIKLGVVDALGRFYSDMMFKIWKSVDQPVLETQWNTVVASNDLKKDDRVDVYTFRFADGKLGFALNIGRQVV